MYRLHLHNAVYEITKTADSLLLKLATKLPGRLRMWVVVDSANESIFNIHPRKDGYAGPDGLDYKQIYDGALRKAS